jgi:C4-dicarboxylate-specific signal transduction histidine kinase
MTTAIGSDGEKAVRRAETGERQRNRAYISLATSVANAVTALRGRLAADLASGVTALRTRAERKRSEEALHQAPEELARVARVTTLGELAASIAHEVNQPLAAIVADATACLNGLQADGPPRDSIREALAGVVNDSNRAGEVITREFALSWRARRSPTELDLEAGEAVRNVAPERRHVPLRAARAALSESSRGVAARRAERLPVARRRAEVTSSLPRCRSTRTRRRGTTPPGRWSEP